jgi:Na+:H+ antiporter, NhaA family
MMKNRFKTVLEKILRNETSGGIILIFSAIIALSVANSNLSEIYEKVLHTQLALGFEDFMLSMPVSHWINDGLMTVFFFVIGMEIKKELLIGELRSIKATILPIAAAIGGMMIPAIIYVICNYNQTSINGFGIPMATDIAFSLGVLSLVGKKAPKGIVVFLTALAIVDDLGAIIVIALFYSSELSIKYLFFSAIVVSILMVLNRLNVKYASAFILLGVLLWFFMLNSGIHATFSGVLLGMAIPGSKDGEKFKSTMLYKLEHKIAPWSTFLIMPIFALANAGVVINMTSLSEIMSTPVSLGIILGLFIGKPLGIFMVSLALVKAKIAKLPSDVKLAHIFGAGVLGGIGFTMSIFVSLLSFADERVLATAKLSIMIVSVAASVTGAVVFKLIENRNQ